MTALHPFEPDTDGLSCCRCALPRSNKRVHTIERATPPQPIRQAPAVPEHVLTVHDAPTTSHTAAASIAPLVGSRREMVLRHVAARSSATGCTTDEVEVALELTHQTCSSIMNALAAAGLLELIPGEDGQPATRATRSKRQAQAWRVSALGRAALGPHVQGVVR